MIPVIHLARAFPHLPLTSSDRTATVTLSPRRSVLLTHLLDGRWMAVAYHGSQALTSALGTEPEVVLTTLRERLTEYDLEDLAIFERRLLDAGQRLDMRGALA